MKNKKHIFDLITRKNNWLFFLVIGLLLIDLLAFNHVLELRAEEPRRAVVTMEMMESGDYIVPHLLGEVYYNKPPVFNWVQSVSMSVFGQNEWAARLPGVLALVSMGWIVFICLKRVVSKEWALLGGLALITSPDLLFYASVNSGEIDLFYSLIIVTQVLSIFYFHRREKYWQLFLISYFLTAIGFLTKGIPSLAFQSITLLVYFIATKRFSKLFSIQHFAGIGLMVSIIGAYFYLFQQSADVMAFLVRQFKESSQRSGNEFGIGSIVVHLFTFPFFVLSKLFPWSLLIVLYFKKEVRSFVWQHPMLKFTVLFLISNILIYAFSPGIRIRYLYMFFPFIIILLYAPIKFLIKENLKVGGMIYYTWLIASVLGCVSLFLLPVVLPEQGTYHFLLSCTFGALMLFFAYMFFEANNVKQIAWVLVLLLLVGRISFNVLVLPQMHLESKNVIYRGLMEDLLEEAQGREIVLTGPTEGVQSDITFLGYQFYSDTIVTPPWIPFQLPFYYKKVTGNILHYKKEHKDISKCYLAYKGGVKNFEDKNVLYEWQSIASNRTMILFELK